MQVSLVPTIGSRRLRGYVPQDEGHAEQRNTVAEGKQENRHPRSAKGLLYMVSQ